jgi:glutamyl-Q tRNA(Asp) synthetase
MYAGRFAPSPTGPLHFGSLVAALASWLDARAAGGRWRVRIEDLDAPRVQPGAVDAILRVLADFGLCWDGPVVFQSTRLARYGQALETLRERTYRCACSRREIADSSVGAAADGSQVYPGTCRGGMPAGRTGRSRRIRVPAESISFVDRVQGPQSQALATEVGDFVLARADGQYSYQLAVVVDDADDGITDVVRGADLIESTPRQIFLQRLLGFSEPRYLHVPAAVNARGEKLSKQTGAAPLDLSSRERVLQEALRFLGQAPADGLEQAVLQWNPGRIASRRTQPAG